MIEKEIIGHLKGLLDVPVFAQVPASPPTKFVTVEKIGGSDSDFCPTASFAIQSWADRLLDAMMLNADVKNAMKSAIFLQSVAGLSLNADYNYTDKAQKKYRYQAVYNIDLF